MAQSKYFICTLGTSVANFFERKVLQEKQAHPGEWGDADPEFEKKLAEFVTGTLQDKTGFHTCCAEASVLKKAGVAPGDRVVLLSADTGLSRMCGEATKRLIVSGFGLGDAAVELVRIPGLQVGDPMRLRSEGLSGFVKNVVSRIEENRYTSDILLCPVGGYKGIVPFLTALGMAFHLPVYYTFERIDSLVRLPPLPFSLDRELYVRAKDALLEIGRRCEMPEGEFLARIKGYTEDERDMFLSFVEPSGKQGFVTSTAFTETFAPSFECDKAPVSRQALEDIKMLSHGQWYRVACKMVIESQDRMMRDQWKHQKAVATDLQILKQGNTSIRVLGYEQGGRFYVCRVLAHGDYDRLLDGKKCPQVSDFRDEEFVEWKEPPEVLPNPVKDEESPYEVAMRKLADYDQRLQSVQATCASRVNEVKRERDKAIGQLEKKLASAEKGQRSLQRNLGKAQNALDQTQNALQDLRNEKDDLIAQVSDAVIEKQTLKTALDAKVKEYEQALEEINNLRGKLREAQTRLAMAPGDAEAVKKAQREIDERKAQIEQAFQTLLMSDKTEIPAGPSEELQSLQLEQRKLAAQLNAKSDEVRMLEQENTSLSDALRAAKEVIADMKSKGLFKRIAWALTGK